MGTAAGYLMESEREALRLEAKEDSRLTERCVRWAGLRRGMRVLDAGAGSGAVARVMARRVGFQGQVVALEKSSSRARFLKAHPGAGCIHTLVGDIHALPLPNASFDFTWSRFVFEYLPDPKTALDELVRVTRPGGQVVVLDLDGQGLFHHPLPQPVERGLTVLQTALGGRLDPFVGRKLFSLFHAAGLQDIRVQARPHHLYAGRAPDAALENWRYKLETLSPVAIPAFGGESGYLAFCREFLDLLSRPDALTYSVLFMVRGTRG